MKSLIITSLNRKEGKTTAAVNILSGLINSGLPFELLDLGMCPDASQWIQKTADLKDTIEILDPDGADFSTMVPGLTSPDSSWLLVDLDLQNAQAERLLALAEIAVLIVKIDDKRADFAEMKVLDRSLAEFRGRGYDLIVPFQYDAHEWENNERFLETLVNTFDWERIANPVPT